MGTMLLAHGVPVDACLEALNLRRPGLIEEIHRSYIDAGAESLLANTFGANRVRLTKHRLQNKLAAINRAGIRIAKKAAGRRPVFASIGPLGREARRLSFTEMLKFFREQARALEHESPAGYVIETMTSLGEAEAATSAVRQVSDRTIFALMTKPPHSPTLTKEAAEIIATTLRNAGADVIGANCGISPEESYRLLKDLSRVDRGPFAARIAAGLPGRILSPEDFSRWKTKFMKLGCRWIGGCCGTTPAHIRTLKQLL